MNINKYIINSLSELEIPISFREYIGNEKTFITFFEVNNLDDDYSDDENETEVFSLQIDVWTDDDPTDLKKKIKKILKNSGFYDVEYQDGEAIESEFHVIFRCYYYSDLEEKESEDDEN